MEVAPQDRGEVSMEQLFIRIGKGDLHRKRLPGRACRMVANMCPERS
jgi:hypothetical protein